MSTTEQKALALTLAEKFDHPIPPDWDEMKQAATELRRLAAFEASTPQFTPLANKKLTELMVSGFRITGFAIERQVEGGAPTRGFINAEGLVGWWTPDTQAELEQLRAQSDSFERKLAELVDLVSPGLDSGDLLDDATSAGVQATALRAQVEALTAELVRKEAALIEWFDKTDWVNKTAKPRELGKHRADVLRERVEALTKDLADANDSAAWHKRRTSLLQSLQSTMQEPERTIVCDVLANGHLLQGPDGLPDKQRYATPAPLTRPAVPDAKAMANRLMGWKLPKNFSPDCFISFDRAGAEACKTWPIGTNLFTVDQATEMFQYVLDAAPQPEAQPTEAAQPDPCPGCTPSSFCKKPTCGRLLALQKGGA